GKKLYVALLEPIPIEDTPLLLGSIQYADLTRPERFDETLHKLIAALRGEPSAPDAPSAAQYPRLTGAENVDRRLRDLPLIGRETDLKQLHDHLKTRQPTFILGIGGVGKSRLAYEIARQGLDGAYGAVWHVCRDVSAVEGLHNLLREHYNKPPETPFRDVLRLIQEQPPLIVLDNADALEGGRQEAYQRLVEDLARHDAYILIISRVAWRIHSKREHRPLALSLEAATAIAAEMAQREQLELPEADLRQLAERARRHPRLIEWSLMQARERPFSRILDELSALQGKRIEEVLNEMIGRTLEQMHQSEPGGAEAAALLKRLNVCRGGFTFAAAQALQGEAAASDADALEDSLSLLIKWRFISKVDRERYEVYPLVVEVIGEDEAAYAPHWAYYKRLVQRHDARQDYSGLAGDFENIAIAFERLRGRDAVAAFWFASACYNFLLNRARARLWADWIQRCATSLANAKDSYLRCAIQNNLGSAYSALAALEDRAGNLARAIAAYREALRFLTPESAPLAYAMTQNNLGLAYKALAALEDRAGNLARAIAAYQEALRFWAPESAPLDYAVTQNNLGTAYHNFAALEDRAGNLARAIAAYQEALRFWTPESVPLAYAMTQNNLGLAYHNLAALEDRAGNLARAIAAYQEALRFWTLESAPLDYAMTQHNLGLAYHNLAARDDRAGNLARAIAAYQEALRFRTPESAPLDYAMTQHNLGFAYRALAELEDRAGNLARAIAAYQEALRFWRRKSAPLAYAMTQHGLGLAHQQAGDLEAACACWRQAERYYRQMGDNERAEEVRRLLQRHCNG
ncbi:MAG: ATP-binding protein, partial [Chloroflexota bacterium]